MTGWTVQIRHPEAWGRLYLESRHRVCVQAYLHCQGPVPASLKAELWRIEQALNRTTRPGKPPG